MSIYEFFNWLLKIKIIYSCLFLLAVDEMRMLQKRLEETEAQMTKILSAMQNMQRSVPNVPSEKTTGQVIRFR